jgi:hypothetical protein
MKAKFEFNLPEDNHDYEIYSNATKLFLFLADLRTYFRNKLKYEELPEKEYEIYEKIHNDIINLILDNEITLEY